jgi:hypothetical protein
MVSGFLIAVLCLSVLVVEAVQRPYSPLWDVDIDTGTLNYCKIARVDSVAADPVLRFHQDVESFATSID